MKTNTMKTSSFLAITNELHICTTEMKGKNTFLEVDGNIAHPTTRLSLPHTQWHHWFHCITYNPPKPMDNIYLIPPLERSVRSESHFCQPVEGSFAQFRWKS